ncbi:hypothetical protein Hanom_Chr11g01057941 [Helianthus anomalus]
MLLKLIKSSELNFEKNNFSLQILWPLGLQFGGWGRTTRVFVESTCNLHLSVSRATSESLCCISMSLSLLISQIVMACCSCS